MIYFLLSGILYGILAGFLAALISPLQFLKVLKQKSGKSYKLIMIDSFRMGGIKIFYRAAYPYMIMNFMTNMSFGFADYIAIILLNVNLLDGFFNIAYFSSPVFVILKSILLRSIVGGFIETIMTFYHEVSEINYNNGYLKKLRRKDIPLFSFLLIRNIFAWGGAVISYEIIQLYMLNGIMFDILVGVLFGIIFAFISLPFDVIVTIRCGEDYQYNIWRQLLIVFRENRNHVFAGFTIRSIQIVLYTLWTLMSMFIVHYILY